MAKKMTYIEVKTAEGKHIFSLYLYEKEIDDAERTGGGSQTVRRQRSAGHVQLHHQTHHKRTFRLIARRITQRYYKT